MSKPKLIKINEVTEHIGQTVSLNVWVQTKRNQGKIAFVVVRDITGIMQVVVAAAQGQIFNQATSIANESVVKITGKLKAMNQAPGGVEMDLDEVEILSSAFPELPIAVYEKGESEVDVNIRLDWRWLDLRKPEKQLIFRAWTTMEQAFRKHMTEQDYIEIHSPKLMGAASESGAEVFEVKYFEDKAYLAQSPQFYKQMAMASGFEKVFEVGPVFRAEPSFTTRHATEFTGYDFEISYIDSHYDIMKAQEQQIIAMLGTVKEAHGAEIKELYDREVVVPTAPFPKLTMAEAKSLLAKKGIKSLKAGDLSPEEERGISEIILERDGHEFVYVTDYPIDARPFYHMRHKDEPSLTKSFDLMWNGLEITTGAQREHRPEVLMKQAKEKGMDVEALDFYMNFFKYGCPPHGGVGMGPNRMIMQLFGLSTLREAMYIFRGPNRLTP